MEKAYELKNKRQELLDKAKKAVEAKAMEEYSASMVEVKSINAEIEALESLDAEAGRFENHETRIGQLALAGEAIKAEEQKASAMDTARSGNEYANAWARAIRNKADVDGGAHDEKLKPLYNALTIGGGTPAGTEGGFLVPVEFDNMIHRKMKDLVRLADYFNVENVTGYTGWRAVETTASRTKLPEIDEAANIPENDKPSFKKITYTVRKFGDRIAISSELLNDNTAGLMAYLAEWFAPRVVMTENALLLGLLDGITAKSFTAGKEVAELKAVLNKGLNTAISRGAVLLANQSSYDFLDGINDADGRGILVPNPADQDVYRFKGRTIIAADNDLIPDRTVTATGAAKGDYYPLYVGNLKAFGTLFRRQALEFAATNIGGQAWTTAATEVRGIARMDAQRVDELAAVRREIFVPAT